MQPVPRQQIAWNVEISGLAALQLHGGPGVSAGRSRLAGAYQTDGKHRGSFSLNVVVNRISVRDGGRGDLLGVTSP